MPMNTEARAKLKSLVRSTLLALVATQVLCLAVNLVRMVMPPPRWEASRLIPVATLALLVYAFRAAERRPVGTMYVLAVVAALADLFAPTLDAATSMSGGVALTWLIIANGLIAARKLRRIDKYHP